MHVTRRLDKEAWRAFVEQHPQGNIFHTPEMYQVFADARGHAPTLWAVVDADGRPLALLTPVTITLMPGPLRWLTSRAVAYGSLLCVPGPQGQQALALLLETYRRRVGSQVLFTELRNVSDMRPWHAALSAQGFVYQPHLNFIVDLDRSTDALLQSIGRRTRKHIRRGLRRGRVQVNLVTDRAHLSSWYTVLHATYHRACVPLADRSLFEAAFDHLAPKGMARFLLATVDGQPAACSLELPYKRTIYGWYGGTDRRFSEHHPNEMLHWHIMAWGAEHGYTAYDFGGAGHPDEPYPVRDFKAKFGGQRVEFGRYTCVHAPRRLFISKWAYGAYRRLMAQRRNRK